MKKTTDQNKGKIKLPIKRILSNNWFAIKLIHKASPGLLLSSVFVDILDALVSFLSSAYLLRYALNGINEGKSFGEIATVLCVFFAILLLTDILTALYFRKFFNVRIMNVSRDVFTLAYQKATDVELACYENPDFYDEMAKAIEGCGHKIETVAFSLRGLIYMVVSFVANFSLTVSIDPVFLLFALIPLAAVPFQSKSNKVKYKKDMEITEEKRRRNYSRRTFYLADYAKEMRLTRMPSLMIDRFFESGREIVRMVTKYGFSLATLGYIKELIVTVITELGATLYAVWKTLGAHVLGYGDCLVIVNSIKTISWTLTDSADTLMQFQDNALYIEHLRKFLNHEPSIKDGKQPLPEGGDLVLQDVSFRYEGAKDYTLRNLSMRFGAGEKIAIVGHNGAGKSTLVKLLLRLYDAEGSITYGGVELKELPVEEYRDIFATVMQDYHIFALTVSENVLLRTRKEGDDALVENALKQSGLKPKIDGFEKGINTVITKEFDKNGELLSGGEAQKLAISHVYSKENRFVILDEPSSALDPIAEYEMYERMTAACEGCGMIFISHRLSSAVMADRIYLLEHGTVLEEGSHTELMARNGRYAEMFRKQAESYREVEHEEI